MTDQVLCYLRFLVLNSSGAATMPGRQRRGASSPDPVFVAKTPPLVASSSPFVAVRPRFRRMHRTPSAFLLVVLALSAAGCASTSETSADKKSDQRLVQEAPLGSRIRKRTNVTPVLGASREDIERARVQQGAIQTGIFQDPSQSK